MKQQPGTCIIWSRPSFQMLSSKMYLNWWISYFNGLPSFFSILDGDSLWCALEMFLEFVFLWRWIGFNIWIIVNFLDTCTCSGCLFETCREVLWFDTIWNSRYVYCCSDCVCGNPEPEHVQVSRKFTIIHILKPIHLHKKTNSKWFFFKLVPLQNFHYWMVMSVYFATTVKFGYNKFQWTKEIKDNKSPKTRQIKMTFLLS
jgi:hypothetical protein